MIQGTTSDAGKSTLVAGIGRALKRRGISVVPFKPQNMALNSAVAVNGGEIGRAQALQAQACGLPPSTDMNPVLLKPKSDTGAQVIVQGQPVGDMDAVEYHRYKPRALEAVMACYSRLREAHSVVLVEGAGSPAEINLREGDIANMGFAEAAGCAVIIVVDIDRGGAFAHLKGTDDCLSPTEQARTIGFVINRFRGDPKLLDPALSWIERATGKPVFGVLPYLQELVLDAEDALPTATQSLEYPDCLRVAVPALPRISNHTDFDGFRYRSDVELVFVGPGRNIPDCDLIVLPGTKQVVDDLKWLQQQGWPQAIKRHLRYGGKLCGICGGFQMLGQSIADPRHVESDFSHYTGLELLPLATTLLEHKRVATRTGRLVGLGANTPASGYEIHCGESEGPALGHPLIEYTTDSGSGFDGAVSEDNQIIGTYWHGLLDTPACQNAIIQWAGKSPGPAVDLASLRERNLDRLASEIERNIDLQQLMNRARHGTSPAH